MALGSARRSEGGIKSAFIYSILPQRLRSQLLNALSTRETGALNEGMKGVDALSPAKRMRILREFVNGMRALESNRRRILDLSILASLSTIAMLAIFSFACAQIRFGSADKAIAFIEIVFESGGMHLALLPLLWGYLAAEYRVRPPAILFNARDLPVNALLALAAATGLALLLMSRGGGGSLPRDPLIKVFYLLVSLSAGPAAEELFFRYLLFMRTGERYGYPLMALVSSLLFAAVHLPDSAWLFAGYLAAGALLCFLCRVRGSLFPAFLAHVIANLMLLFI